MTLDELPIQCTDCIYLTKWETPDGKMQFACTGGRVPDLEKDRDCDRHRKDGESKPGDWW